LKGLEAKCKRKGKTTMNQLTIMFCLGSFLKFEYHALKIRNQFIKFGEIERNAKSKKKKSHTNEKIIPNVDFSSSLSSPQKKKKKFLNLLD